MVPLPSPLQCHRGSSTRPGPLSFLAWTCLAFAAAATLSVQGVEGRFRTLTGEVRLTNTDPAWLERLDAPGNLGMSSLTVRAAGVAPDEGRSAQVNPPVPGRLVNRYDLAVQVGATAAEAITYDVQAVVGIDGDRQLYHLRPVRTPALAEGGGEVPVDLAECVAGLRLVFVDGAGAPVAVEGGSGYVHEGDVLRSIVLELGPHGTERLLVVPAGVPLTVALQVRQGADLYSDQIQHAITLVTNVACDTLVTVPVIIPDTSALGRITGTVDMEGEFEWTTEASPVNGRKGRTAIIGIGPAGNRRFDWVGGDNQERPASGGWELENLLPSDAVSPAEPWRLHAELHFRKGRQFEYFVSPALGEGSNPGVTVGGGETQELGDRFRFRPGVVSGRIRLAGPPPTAGSVAVLRGLERPDDGGVDAFGVPLNSGAFGINASHVIATGVDEAAPGATFTAAGGRAAANFDGAWDPETGAFEGTYALVVGGLEGQASVWRRDGFAMSVSTAGVADAPFVNQVLTVTETSAPARVVGPGETVVDDLRLGLGEVRIRLRSPGRRTHSPTVSGDIGTLAGVDFEGRTRTYDVRIDAATGVPTSVDAAGAEASLTLLLPEGDYELHPLVVVVGEDGSESLTELGALALRVGARQRVGLEACLRLVARLPEAATNGVAGVTGRVETCGQSVTRLSYRVDDGVPVDVPLPGAGGGEAGFEFPATLPADGREHVLTVTVEDGEGGESSVTGRVRPGPAALALRCPGPVSLEADAPCGTAVFFDLAGLVTGGGEPAVVATPASGSRFPVGTTEVQVVATNAAGERAECRFPVTLGGVFPEPTMDEVRPGRVAVGSTVRLSLRGTGFLPADEVRVGGLPVGAAAWQESGEITWEAPALPAGEHDVTLWRCGEQVARLVGGLALESDRPELTGVVSGDVLENGLTQVTFLGRGLHPGLRVRVAFPAPSGAPEANLLREAIFGSDGTTVSGFAPSLPDGEITGPKTVVLEAADGTGLGELVGALNYARDGGDGGVQVAALRRYQAAASTPARVRMREGFPARLAGRVRVDGGDAVGRARAFVREYAPLLRLGDADQELAVAGVAEREFDRVTLRQRHLGVPVHGASMVVLLDGPEVFHAQGYLVSSEVLAARVPEVRPALTAEQAEERVRAARAPMPSVQLLEPSSLAIYDPSVGREGVASEPRLVWRVAYRGAREEHFVDARTGAVVYRRALVHSATGGPLPGFELDLRDAQGAFNADDYGCLVVGFADFVADEDGIEPAYRNHPVAPLLADWAREIYGYYFRHFGRDSYDDDGAEMVVVMNSSMPAGGAWFHSGCEVMEFMPGNEDLEVFTHELTHAVIDSSSELEYVVDSGALNEHYADLMAVLLSRELGARDWLLGDARPSGQGASRDISNPARPAQGRVQPAHLRNQTILGPGVEPSEANDWGGVHVNSGIANLAAYRLITGVHLPAVPTNREPAVSIWGIGEAKARQLLYAAMTGLPSDATFRDARDMEVALAEYLALRGLLGFTASDACDVRNAWASVGVGPYDTGCDRYDEPDTDADGVPDYKDNCRKVANPDQKDRDLDGVGNACDNCMAIYNPRQENQDGDPFGDACDRDRDGDGCHNGAYDPQTGVYSGVAFPEIPDHFPDRRMQVVGYNLVIAVTACEGGEVAFFGFEGDDSDGDGTPNCADYDDDNDGLLDAAVKYTSGGSAYFASDDRCPTTPRPREPGAILADSIRRDECTTLTYCSGSQPTVQLPPGVADGGIFVRFGQHVNPNPEGDFLWDGVRLVGDRVVIDPGPGRGVAALAGKLASLGGRGGRALHGGAPEPLRVELWAKGTNGAPARLVRVLGTFEPGVTPVGDAGTGALLVLQPADRFDAPVQVASVWLDHEAPGSVTRDTDGDGMPDGFELRNGFNPRDPADAQADADDDGRSNVEEFREGMDPRVADAAPLWLAASRAADGQLRLTWAGEVGVRLQRNVGLASSGWEDVPGTEGVSVQEIGTTGTAVFYRVRRGVP